MDETPTFVGLPVRDEVNKYTGKVELDCRLCGGVHRHAVAWGQDVGKRHCFGGPAEEGPKDYIVVVHWGVTTALRSEVGNVPDRQ
jgi:hypothetical protein